MPTRRKRPADPDLHADGVTVADPDLHADGVTAQDTPLELPRCADTSPARWADWQRFWSRLLDESEPQTHAEAPKTPDREQ